MNCYLYGYGSAQCAAQVADGRPRHHVSRGRGRSGRRRHPARSALHRGARSTRRLVLTHAHEDHIGAVIELWPRIKCPIYATPFTAAMLKAKLAEFGNKAEDPIIEVAARRALRCRAVRLRARHHGALDPGAVGLACARRTARCCTPATGSSTRRPMSVLPPTKPPSPPSATRACWRSSAIRPMPSATAARRPRAMSPPRSAPRHRQAPSGGSS